MVQWESLCKKEDFDKVFHRPDYKISATGLLMLAKTNNLKYSRLGMAIAKKNLKKATRRNALKRRIRSRFIEHTREIEPSLDCVVISLSDVGKMDDRQTGVAAQRLFEKLRESIKK